LLGGEHLSRKTGEIPQGSSPYKPGVARTAATLLCMGAGDQLENVINTQVARSDGHPIADGSGSLSDDSCRLVSRGVGCFVNSL